MKSPRTPFEPGQRIGQPWQPKSVEVPDKSPEISPEYVKEAIWRLESYLNRLALITQDRSRNVDEYRVQTLASDAETSTIVQPQFEQMSERIESVIVTGPVPQPLQSGFVSVTSPGAGQVITSLNLPEGQWKIDWSVALGGTVSASDDNNFQLESNGVQLLTSVNAFATATIFPQSSVEVNVGPAGSVISVNAIVAGTVGGVYRATIIATPVIGTGVPFQLQLGGRVWNLFLPPTGILVVAPVGISLDRTDPRQLTSPVSGDWSIELMGFADSRYRTP